MGKKPVLRSKLHNAKKAMSNEQMAILRESDAAQAKKMAELARRNVETRQDKIDHYNGVICNKIDPFFNTLQLTGKNIIVRMHKENYIKNVSEYSDGVPLYEAWTSQVDGRPTREARARWVDNPLPYIFTGVVVAMSPSARIDANKEVKLIKEELPGVTCKALEVGDIIHMEHFMYADKRFYVDKQKRDFIKNPEEYKIEHWEGYIKIHPSLIEGVVLNPKSFIGNTSPYAKYKARKAYSNESVLSKVKK